MIPFSNCIKKVYIGKKFYYFECGKCGVMFGTLQKTCPACMLTFENYEVIK